MSRIGKKTIEYKDNIKIALKDTHYEVTNGKNTINVPLVENIKVKFNKDTKELLLENIDSKKKFNANWGLLRSLLNNAVIGLTDGFERDLEMVGVGYRAQVTGKKIVLNAGYSHPVELDIPEDLEVLVADNVKIKVKGYDKQRVGHLASLIRNVRKPEPYKGKGIKYSDEVIRRKAGKAAKSE